MLRTTHLLTGISFFRSSIRIASVLGLGFLLGCSSCPFSKHQESFSHFQTGEPVLLAGEQPATLAFQPSHSPGPVVRSTYRPTVPGSITYEEGKDYIIDYKTGTIQRTSTSKIPDFSTNMLYGKKDFDHSKFPGYGNKPFFAYLDYRHDKAANWHPQASQTKWLNSTIQKLQKGDKLKLVAFGDSITAGGEASETNLIYWQRWANFLQQKYPKASIEAINGATGGDTTRNGLERLNTKVISQQPDLVLIAFGMNDHNIQPFGVPLDEFKKNLGTLIDRIRSDSKGGTDILLVSAFPPNPQWHYGSHRMEQYAQATEAVAQEKQCAFADVYNHWITLTEHKKPEDLLANNINHPNDFGHWIYFEALKQLDL
jgi:acyl-CoA thioesterase I